ncbi:MAG: hypothetical protein QXW10_04270, partial [Candidatus Micrarchaeaceae archaeon]
IDITGFGNAPSGAFGEGYAHWPGMRGMQGMQGGVNFMVFRNGTLSLLAVPEGIGPKQQSLPYAIGYVLPGHASVKLSYYGNIGAAATGLQPNQSAYRLIIFTNRGALQANVTAG